jgi:chemotaxis protein histidine kinase CheA
LIESNIITIVNLEMMMNSTSKNSANTSVFGGSVEFFDCADEICVHIDRMEAQMNSFFACQKSIPDTKQLLRSMHSIKGTAGFWNVTSIQEVAHQAETCLLDMENEGQDWTEATANMVVGTCQELRHLLQLPVQAVGSLFESSLVAKQAPDKPLEGASHWRLSLHGLDGSDDLDGVQSLLEMMTDCVRLVEIRGLGEDQQSWSLMSTLHPEELVSLFRMHVSTATHVSISPVSESIGAEVSESSKIPALSSADGLAKTLRVQVDSLSALQAVVVRLADLQEPSSSPQTAALVFEIKQRLNDIRMVAVADTLSRYEPMVQTLAQRLHKKIAWHLNGGSTLVDRRLMERVNEPLMHLVRNSCDHGIEKESVRLANGKLPVGHIVLDVFRSGAGLHFNLTDDGSGLSCSALLERARLKGLAMPKDTASDAEIWELIFEPGFSTASQVSDISGRGVGLDVVRQSILDLGGSVQLESKEGVGVTFAITVPEPSGW